VDNTCLTRLPYRKFFNFLSLNLTRSAYTETVSGSFVITGTEFEVPLTRISNTGMPAGYKLSGKGAGLGTIIAIVGIIVWGTDQISWGEIGDSSNECR
jgi:hypothetical protein